MKRWRTNVRFHLGITAALHWRPALGLVYSFSQYKDQIIPNRREQLLTIIKWSPTLSPCTQFLLCQSAGWNTCMTVPGGRKAVPGDRGRKADQEIPSPGYADPRATRTCPASWSAATRRRQGTEVLIQGGEDRTYHQRRYFDGRRTQESIFCGMGKTSFTWAVMPTRTCGSARSDQHPGTVPEGGFLPLGRPEENGCVIKDSTSRILMHLPSEKSRLTGRDLGPKGSHMCQILI